MGHNTEGTGKRRNELRHYIDHDEYQKIDRRDRSVFHDRFRSLIVVLQFELRAKQNTDDYFLYASVTRNKEESMDSYWTLVFAIFPEASSRTRGGYIPVRSTAASMPLTVLEDASGNVAS